MERLQEAQMPTNRGGAGDEIAIAAGGTVIGITDNTGEPVLETAVIVSRGECIGETGCESSVTFVFITRAI